MFFLPSLVIGVVCLKLVHDWATRSFEIAARHRRRLAWALVGLLGWEMLIGWIARTWYLPLFEDVQTAGSIVQLTIDMAAMPIVAMRLVGWVAGRLRAVRASDAGPAAAADPAPAAAAVEATAAAPRGLSRRQLVEGIAGLGAIGASGAMLGWGAVVGRHAFETCEVPIRIAGLPRALDGYVIAQISDLHVGIHLSDRDFDRGLDLVRRARPDLIVVTGDIVDRDAGLAPYAARKLADLPARDGVATILGNHDYYAGADEVTAALRAAGIAPLVNGGRVVRPGDGGGFALLGVDDRTARRHGKPGPDLDRALAAVRSDAPRVLLSHQPMTVDEWPGRVALQLSGHTHGGQVNPGFEPVRMFLRYVKGVYSVGGTTLYVNRGFGTVGPPARVGAPPEVTRIVLVAA